MSRSEFLLITANDRTFEIEIYYDTNLWLLVKEGGAEIYNQKAPQCITYIFVLSNLKKYQQSKNLFQGVDEGNKSISVFWSGGAGQIWGAEQGEDDCWKTGKKVET